MVRAKVMVRSLLTPLVLVSLAAGMAGCEAAAQAHLRTLPRPPAHSATIDIGPALPTPTPTPTPKPTPKPARTTPRPRPSTTTANPGIGVWLLAPGGSAVFGSGSKEFISYRVEVEQATGLNAASVATMVDATLGHPDRGWTVGGWRFQRTDLPASQVGMVVRVATPATVDKICGAAGVNTGGVVSCRAGKLVMINLTRWTVGIPAYADVNDYRHLVINHEVGHRLGFGHTTCQTTGLPEAPVMMTQYYGLNGCTPNVWPYRADGTFVH
ncbi:MAG: DUF3152 domain-containing protein [Micromonosporaceae bacterium]